MELACEMFVVGDKEKGREQGRKKRGKKGRKMGEKKGMKEERNEVNRWKEWKTFVAIRFRET
jgi:hypothetical protein